MGARRKARELALQMLFQRDISGNLPDQIGVVDRTARIGRLQNVDFETALRQIFSQAQGPLYTNPADRREEIGDQQNL